MTWIHDVVISYVSGIVLGAPVGLAAFWITGQRETVTGAVLATMCGLLVIRRAIRRRHAVTAGRDPISVSTAAQA